MTRSAHLPHTVEARALDAYLVVCAQGGSRTAFEELARRWRRRLVAHAWRLTGDMEAAHDAAQAGWVEIARGIARLRDEEAFAAWAYRIVSRQCAKLIRGRQRDRSLAGALALEEETRPDDATAGECEPRLRRAIRDLPPVQRAAVGLFYFDDLSVAEIAVALSVPAGTVKTRLMHARRALRAVLDGDFDANR